MRPLSPVSCNTKQRSGNNRSQGYMCIYYGNSMNGRFVNLKRAESKGFKLSCTFADVQPVVRLDARYLLLDSMPVRHITRNKEQGARNKVASPGEYTFIGRTEDPA